MITLEAWANRRMNSDGETLAIILYLALSLLLWVERGMQSQLNQGKNLVELRLTHGWRAGSALQTLAISSPIVGTRSAASDRGVGSQMAPDVVKDQDSEPPIPPIGAAESLSRARSRGPKGSLATRRQARP